VTASVDHTTRIWDADTGHEIMRLRHENAVTSLALNADGTRCATVSGPHTADVWDVSSGRQLARVQHEREVTSAIFNADGTSLVTTSFDHTARVWNVATAKELVRLQHDSEVLGAVFAAADHRLATSTLAIGGMAVNVLVWDAASGKEIASLFIPGRLSSGGFSADGQWVVIAAANGLWIGDATNGNVRERLPNETSELASSAVTFSADGQNLVAVSGDRITRWDTQWLTGLHGNELKRAICREKLVGAQRLTREDVIVAPLLGGRAGEPVCVDRRGMLKLVGSF
jgi:WD40 repeat protein